MEQGAREQHATLAFPKPYHLSTFPLSSHFPLPFITSNRVDVSEHTPTYTHIRMAINNGPTGAQVYKSKTWYKASPIP